MGIWTHLLKHTSDGKNHSMHVTRYADIQISEMVTQLRAGETMVYPTETCYGLGCDATNSTAVERLFAIKKRQKNKPMLVVFPDVAMAMRYIQWSPQLEKLASRFWPGPLTIVTSLQSDTNISSLLVGEDGTLAFRVSSHPFVQEVTQALGTPIVSTSANIAGEDDPYDVRDVIARFFQEEIQPDMIVDAGVLRFAAPSTIVKMDHGKLQVLRQGEVHVGHIKE